MIPLIINVTNTPIYTKLVRLDKNTIQLYALYETHLEYKEGTSSLKEKD